MKALKIFCASAALAAATVASASAATICVKPTGSTTTTGNPCYASLGYALAGTSPQVAAGDVITVAAGRYKEPTTISIGNTLTGLHIVGPSSAIIDNEILSGNSSDIIDVYASDVLIQGLSLRNGRGSYGIWVSTSGNNFTLTGTTMNGVNGTCVNINGNDATVKSSKFYGCGDVIDFYGKNITVTGNIFRGSDCYGLYGEANTTNGYDLGTVTFSHNQHLYSFCSAVYLYGYYNGSSAQPGAGNAIIQSNTINSAESYGIYVGNDPSNTPGSVVVTGNKITSVYYSGIYLANMDANTITANSIKYASDSYGIFVNGGGGHTISSNLISGTYNAGIYVANAFVGDYPDGTTIKLNKVQPDGYTYGIYAASGSGMTISNNTVSNSSYGIYTANTDQLTMIANNINNSIFSGIHITCLDDAGNSASCTGATLTSNKITGTQDDPGLYFYAYGAGPGAIQLNTNIVKNTPYTCFDLHGDNLTLARNQALYCGGGTGYQGFSVQGNNNTLTANVARYATGDGIYISGDSAVLTSNVASNNSEDGIDIHGSSATLNTNHATLNVGTGIEIASGYTGPSGAGNVATGNSVDLCDAGTSTTMTGTFPTGGSVAACDEASGYIGD